MPMCSASSRWLAPSACAASLSSTQFQRLAPCSPSRRSSSSCTVRCVRKSSRPIVGFHSALMISTLMISQSNSIRATLRSLDGSRRPGPSLRTFSTCTRASRSWSIHSPSWSPTRRTHHASAWLRLRATPASTSVSSTWRSGRRRRVITGTLSVVKSSSSSPQRAPQATLRAKRASASSAMRMRSARVSSRKPWMRARHAAATRVGVGVAAVGDDGGRGEGAQHHDLVAVVADRRRAGEPAVGEAAGEPALELGGGGNRGVRRWRWCPSAW